MRIALRDRFVFRIRGFTRWRAALPQRLQLVLAQPFGKPVVLPRLQKTLKAAMKRGIGEKRDQ
jgi:hypothetical protein